MNKKRLLTLVLLSTLIIGFISLFFVEIGSNPVKINNDSDNIDSPKKLVFNDLDGLHISTSNVLSSKYLTINDKDNLYDSVYYWVNGSLYDSTNIFRDFQSGKLQTEYGTYSALNQNYTLLNDMNNNYWSNYSNNYDPTMGNGSYNDVNGTFSSTNIGFNYDYLYHTSTNYNYSIYNQIFTSPDGSMGHNYQPDGYNSSYTINNKLYMQNLFPNEQFWEMWDSYSLTTDPSYTNSSFNKYNFVTNVTVEPGNGQYISGGINELKYYDFQYYKAKSSLYGGDQILYIDFDFTDGTQKWSELDGDYFLYFSCNRTMEFRDKNYEYLWSGSYANGVYINDIDDWIYICKEQADPFSIQIDYLFLLDPQLSSILNSFSNYIFATGSNYDHLVFQDSIDSYYWSLYDINNREIIVKDLVSDDTYINASSPSTNYGNNNYLYAINGSAFDNYTLPPGPAGVSIFDIHCSQHDSMLLKIYANISVESTPSMEYVVTSIKVYLKSDDSGGYWWEPSGDHYVLVNDTSGLSLEDEDYDDTFPTIFTRLTTVNTGLQELNVSIKVKVHYIVNSILPYDTERIESIDIINGCSVFIKNEMSFAYLTSNYTKNSILYLGVYSSSPYITKQYELCITSNFAELTLTYNNQPSVISNFGMVNIVLDNLPKLIAVNLRNNYYPYFILNCLNYSTIVFISSENPTYTTLRPYINYYISKEYQGGGYKYIQTNKTETLRLRSPVYAPDISLFSGDYLNFSIQTTTNKEIKLKFYNNGVLQKEVIMLSSGNSIFSDQILKIVLSSDVIFDQLELSGEYDDTKYLKLYGVSMYTYTFPQNSMESIDGLNATFQSGNSMSDYPAYESFNNMTTNYGEYWDERFTNKTMNYGEYYDTRFTNMTMETGVYYGTTSMGGLGWVDPFDADLGKTGTNIKWIKYIASDQAQYLAQIVPEYRNHSNVLRLSSTGAGGKYLCTPNETIQASSGIMTWWMGTDVGTSAGIYIGDESDHLIVFISVSPSIVYAYYGNGIGGYSYVTIPYTNNFAQFKVSFDCSTDKFSCWVNETLLVNNQNFMYDHNANYLRFVRPQIDASVVGYFDDFEYYWYPQHPYGYYYGSPDNFNDEPIGETGLNIAWVDYITAGDTAEIISSIGDHKKVLKYTPSAAWHNIIHTTNGLTSDTYEFWTRFSDVNKDYWTYAWCPYLGTASFGVYWENGGDVHYFDGTTFPDTGQDFVANVWYHIRMDYDFDGYFVWHLYINGIQIGGDLVYKAGSTVINNVYFNSANDYGEVWYLDAWGESSDNCYYTGQNTNPYDIMPLINSNYIGVGNEYWWSDFGHLSYNTSVSINQFVDGHKDVIEVYDNSAVDITSVFFLSDYYVEEGTVEFWIKLAQNDKCVGFFLQGGEGGMFVRGEFGSNGYIRINNATTDGYDNVIPYISNVWYHIRIDFIAVYTDKFDMYVNGTLVCNQWDEWVGDMAGEILFWTNDTDIGTKFWIDAVGFSWDEDSNNGEGYTIGYNTNPYDIMPFLNVPYTYLIPRYGAEFEIEPNIDGHKDVLRMRNENTVNYAYYFFHYYDGGTKSYGSVEFWCKTNDNTKPVGIYFRKGGFNNSIDVLIGASGRVKYYDGAIWQDVCYAGSNWIHIRIDFECDSGAYKGLSADRWHIYVNGTHYGDFQFQNGVDFDYIDLIAPYDLPNNNVNKYIDSICFSWDTNYKIGYNVNPYNISEFLNPAWTLYNDVYEWISIPFNNWFNVSNVVDGHNKVLTIYDGSGAGFITVQNNFVGRGYGTVEFWIRSTDVTQRNMYCLGDKAYFYMQNDDFEYYDAGVKDVPNAPDTFDNTWYHIRWEIESTAGGYMGLGQDKQRFYINGISSGELNIYDPNGLITYFYMCGSNTPVSPFYTYLDAPCYSWDNNYIIGDNINSYNISDFKSKGWSMNYAYPGSYMRINSSVDGHSNVLEMCDNTGTKDSDNDYVKLEMSFTAQTSGTIEFYIRKKGDYSYYFYVYSSSNVKIMLLITSNKFRAYYNSAWYDITGGSILNNRWYHIRIEFECGSGTYKGLTPDTYHFYINGVLKETIAFSFGAENLNTVFISTDNLGYNPTYTLFIDAITYSWAPGYSAFSNMYNVKLDFISTIQAPDLYNKYSNDTFDYITLHYSFKTNISTVASIYAYNFVLNDWMYINASVNKNGFYDCVFSLSSNYFNSTKHFKIRIIGGNDTGNRFLLYLEMLRIDYKWTKISGDIYAILSKTTIFDFLNRYDVGYNDYLNLFKFDYIFNYRFGNITNADGWYYGAPDNFNLEIPKRIYNVGDIAWVDGVSYPGDSQVNLLPEMFNHKNVLELKTVTGGVYPSVYHYFTTQTSGTVEFWWAQSSTPPSAQHTLNLFQSNPWLAGVSLWMDGGYYKYLDLSGATISTGVAISSGAFDRHKIVFNCVSNRFDWYINGILAKSNCEFRYDVGYLDVFYMAHQTGSACSLYLDAPGEVWDSNYDEGDNLNPRENPYDRSVKFNGVSLVDDGNWHTADFQSIYDSSTGDGTINLEFNISNGLLEIRTFKYVMWFGCIDAVNGRRQLQQIFSVEWPGEGTISDYVAENGMFSINVKYNFTTINDGYAYTNTYNRHSKLEINYAVKADGTWYYAMWATNTTSIITNIRVVNVTDMMKSLGLEKFEDFAVTFIMIGNNSKINVLNVSLWDKRAVVPAKLNFTVYHEFTIDYVLNYIKLLYGWNTTNYNQVNVSIYCFNNNSWYLLKTGYNKGVIILYNFVSYQLYENYVDSNNKTFIKVECGQNYTHNYNLNLRTNYNYRTGVWVSYELAFDERGIWRYRFVLVSSGLEYYTSWVYFDVVEPKPNFRAVSSSDYITTWVLTQNATSSELLRFEDDLDYGAWLLTSPSNKYLSYNVNPNDDSFVADYAPDQNYGWSSSIDILTYSGSGHPGAITYGFVEDGHAETYLNDNNTMNRPHSTFNFYAWYDPYWPEQFGSGSTDWYYTYDFSENTVTWNNKPAQNGFLVNVPYPGLYNWGQISFDYKLPVYFRIEPHGSTSDLRFLSAEGGAGGKCYFTHYVPKSYHNSTLKYWYMQTSLTETLEMTSPEYPTDTQIYTDDYIKVDCQTTSSDMDVTFLLGGVPVKTIPLMRGNTEYNRQTIEVLLDSDVYFDQIRFSGPFSSGKYFKCFDVKILGLDQKSESVVERDVTNEAEIFALAGVNSLKIYERGILKVSKYVTLSYDYNELWVETFIGSLLGECHFTYQDENNEPLSFDYFKIYVNYTADNSTILNEQLFTNFLYVDENTYITFTVYDTFDVVILTTTRMEYMFIELELPVYSLKIQNGATEQVYYALTKNTSSVVKSGRMFSSEIIEYKIASGDYNLAYINYEDSIIRNTNFTLANNKLISINTTYYQLYVSCFNFDGLGLDENWVRLYINNLRKDFGFNTLKTDYTRFVVLDFFNATLTNETVCTRMYTEYNLYIQVYNMILNNNYTHSIFITIERPSVNMTIKQIVPAQSSINYRFLPGINYNISYFYINGTRIGSVNVTLVDNNQIVSFGYYSVEIPSPYYQLVVSCFNYNGVKLDTAWVYLYINGMQSGFGTNVMDMEYNLFVITDLFGEVLSSEIVYTKNMTQYNADVTIYGMILNNNYTHSIYIELTRPNSSMIMKQIIPAQSGVLYRFCPDTDYVISYYYINGTRIDEIRVTLETDNQIVSFGWYAAEVPAGPSKELIMGQMWLDIVVIISCFVVIITFTLYLLRKYIKNNKEQQKYIYNTNKSKTNLEVKGLLGKTHYFK